MKEQLSSYQLSSENEENLQQKDTSKMAENTGLTTETAADGDGLDDDGRDTFMEASDVINELTCNTYFSSS